MSQPLLISLAPLTNIALALSLEPRLPQLCPETCPQDELDELNEPSFDFLMHHKLNKSTQLKLGPLLRKDLFLMGGTVLAPGNVGLLSEVGLSGCAVGMCSF